MGCVLRAIFFLKKEGKEAGMQGKIGSGWDKHRRPRLAKTKA